MTENIACRFVNEEVCAKIVPKNFIREQKENKKIMERLIADSELVEKSSQYRFSDKTLKKESIQALENTRKLKN